MCESQRRIIAAKRFDFDLSEKIFLNLVKVGFRGFK